MPDTLLAGRAAPLGAIALLVAGAVVMLMLAQPLSRRPSVSAGLGVAFALAAGLVGAGAPAPQALAVVSLCALAGVALLLVPSLELELVEHAVETGALLLLGSAGAIAVATSGDLLEAVVGLETLALSAVTLVAIGRGALSLEAAFKYLVLGAIALAALLFGLGLVYLGSGSFSFPAATRIGAGGGLVLAGLLLITLAFAFELAIFPFHWGALDTYTAAAPGLAGFVMSASKLAAAFVLARLVAASGSSTQDVLVWAGTATIAWGTFGALAQTGLRRLLGYSAVTHAGFIALAAGSGSSGPQVAIFYAVVYASMAMLTFGALSGGGDATGSPGRGRASALALGLVSLSGIPPTPGFWAKLAVLVVAWQSAGLVPTLVAILGGVFGVLYYLRPLPDLFAALRAAPGEARPLGALPAVAVAAAGLSLAVLAVVPSLAWVLAHQ